MKFLTEEYNSKWHGRLDNFDELEAALAGKSIEEQIKCFCTRETSYYEECSYGSVDSSKALKGVMELNEDRGISKLILKDGIIVGIIKRSKTVLAGENVCTYFAVDEDGTGRDSVEEYTTLILKK
jgi:hypothetical protein